MTTRSQAVGIIRRELIDNPNDIDGLASDIFDALSAAHLIAGGGEAVGYIREESRESLATGGHGIEGTVPLHAQQTRWATIPVYACPAPALTAGVAGDSVNAAFDQWYARQRHQLTNEQVCRLIWTRGWEACAASPPDAPTPSPGYVLVRENDWLARLSHGEALVNAVLAPTAGVGESIHERIAENFDGDYLSGFKEIDSFEKWAALVRRLLEAYERMRASPPAPDGWRPEVRAFATLMERELKANDHKGGWKNDSIVALARRVCEEALELLDATQNQDRDTYIAGIAEEAADVANMAMMVADVCGALPTDTGGA